MKKAGLILGILACIGLYSCDNKKSNANTNSEVEESVGKDASTSDSVTIPSATGPGENNGAQSGAGTAGDTSILSTGQGSGTGSGSMGSGEVASDSGDAKKSK